MKYIQNSKKTLKERQYQRKSGRPLTPYGFSLLAKKGDDSPFRNKPDLIFLSEYRERALQDQGATEETISANRLVLTDRAVSVLGALRTIERDVARFGVFLKDGRLHPLLVEIYPRYVNLLRSLLNDLGLEKKEMDDGFDVVKYARGEYDDKGDSRAQDDSGKEIESGDGESVEEKERVPEEGD